jgi:hypothetical protein
MMLLSRKKIAAVVCTALLAVAGVANYTQYNKARPASLELPPADEKYETETNYGEARYVSDMSLEKSRSESVALLKTVAGDEQASAEKRAEAQSEIIRIAKDIEKEAVTKELLSQKGFSEVSVFLNSPQATVSVKGDGLTPGQVAKIRDTMRHDGNILPQNLTIIERK